jgi:exosortase
MSIAGTETSMSSARFEPLRWPLAGAAILSCIYVFVFWDFLSRQVRWAFKHPADWGHTLAIPLLAAYFIYVSRERLLARPFRTCWLGVLPILLGLGWYSLCTLNDALRNHNLQGFGVWLTLFGLVLLFCGVRAMRFLWFPLAYVLVFGQSVSDRGMSLITYGLQDIAARGSYVALRLLQFDIDRVGNTLFIYDANGVSNPLNIAEACSGMRMVMAMLALGVALAFLRLDRFWERAILVVLALPVAIFVNILRVVTLAVLSLVDVGLAAGDFHTFVGLIWLVPALFIYFGIIWVIRQMVVQPETAAAGPA